jgi:hypothetical protein
LTGVEHLRADIPRRVEKIRSRGLCRKRAQKDAGEGGGAAHFDILTLRFHEASKDDLISSENRRLDLSFARSEKLLTGKHFVFLDLAAPIFAFTLSA